MKRRSKAKPRVTQLDRIELRLRDLPRLLALIKDCAVLASHNRRLLEENDALRRLQQARGDSSCPECHQPYGWHALDCKLNAPPRECIHQWQMVAGRYDKDGERYVDVCVVCGAYNRRHGSVT